MSQPTNVALIQLDKDLKEMAEKEKTGRFLIKIFPKNNTETSGSAENMIAYGIFTRPPENPETNPPAKKVENTEKSDEANKAEKSWKEDFSKACSIM